MIKLVGEKLYQWQIDRQVEIIPREGEIITKVYCIVRNPRPLTLPFTMSGASAIAELPNRAFLDCGTISVCVEYMCPDCGEVRKESQAFTVHRAERPADFVFEPNDVLDEYSSGGSGGGGEVKFYPEVITLDGYDSLAQGEQISVEKDIAIGTYAILQPSNGKRALGKCVSDTSKTAVDIRQATASEIPSIGTTSGFFGSTNEYNIGDYIVIKYVGYPPTYALLGYALAQVTNIQSDNSEFIYILVEILPNESNGEYYVTQNRPTVEVITVLDGNQSGGSQLYQHFIEGTDADGSVVFHIAFLLSFATPITNDNLETLIAEGTTIYPLSAENFNTNSTRGVFYNNASYMGGRHISFDAGSSGSYASCKISDYTITDTVTPL